MSNNNKQNEAERVNREVLVDVYGRTPPDAADFRKGAHVGDAKFGQGTQAAPQVEQATDARRNNTPLGRNEFADRNRK
jgi:hypothetical protein